MFKSLRSGYSIIRIVHKQFNNQILNFVGSMRYQFCDSSSFDRWEIELHVRCIFLEFLKKSLFRCAEYIMNFMHLVKFVVTREEREK